MKWLRALFGTNTEMRIVIALLLAILVILILVLKVAAGIAGSIPDGCGSMFQPCEVVIGR